MGGSDLPSWVLIRLAILGITNLFFFVGPMDERSVQTTTIVTTRAVVRIQWRAAIVARPSPQWSACYGSRVPGRRSARHALPSAAVGRTRRLCHRQCLGLVETRKHGNPRLVRATRSIWKQALVPGIRYKHGRVLMDEVDAEGLEDEEMIS